MQKIASVVCVENLRWRFGHVLTRTFRQNRIVANAWTK